MVSSAPLLEGHRVYVQPVSSLRMSCTRGGVEEVLDVKAKCVAAKEALLTDIVLPQSCEQYVQGLTSHPVNDLKGLLEKGFMEKPNPLLADLLIDKDNCLGRCKSISLLLTKRGEEKTVRGMELLIDCAIYPGVGDLIITGEVSSTGSSTSSSMFRWSDCLMQTVDVAGE